MKKKIAIACILLAFVAALMLPVLASADTLGDYAPHEDAFIISANTETEYRATIINIFDWGNIYDIQTRIPYSDSEADTSEVFLEVSFRAETYGFEYYYYPTETTPPQNTYSIFWDFYDVNNDPDAQDILGAFNVKVYQSGNDPDYYAFDIIYDDASGGYYMGGVLTISIYAEGSQVDPVPPDDPVDPLPPYDEGYANGYEAGYQAGKTDGYQQGYDVGYMEGQLGNGSVSVAKTLFGVVVDLLSTPIMGYISVADILLIIIVLGIVFLIIRIATRS